MSYEVSAAIGTFIGGLGLFFTGIRSLSVHMLHLGSGTLRRALLAKGQNPVLIALVGTLAGAFLQSANGITFILVSMVTAGLLPVESALSLLAWANLGTTALVALSASFSLHVPTLLALGVAGTWLYLDTARSGLRRQIVEVVLAIALLFMGLEFLRLAIVQLRGFPEMSAVLAAAGTSYVAAVLAGVFLTLLTQSFATTGILAVVVTQAGLIPFDHATLLVMGAAVGAGLSVFIISGNVRGSQRQLILFQVLVRSVGVLLLAPILLIENLTGQPLLMHAIRAASHDVGRQLSLIYLSCQGASLGGWYMLRRPFRRFLSYAAPPLESEKLAEPRYIANGVMLDADLALTLAAKEQARLVDHLFRALGTIDTNAERAFTGLCDHIAGFLIAIFRTAEQDSAPLTPPQLDRLANLQARNEALRLQHDTLTKIAKMRAELDDAEARAMADRLVEGLGAVLLCANDAVQSNEADDLEVLRRITTSRSKLIDALHRNLIHIEQQDAIYTLTSLFERAVWLLHRYTQLLETGRPDSDPAFAAGELQPSTAQV